MGIKTYQEKNTNPMKKTRAQSGLPVKRKIQKTTGNVTFFKDCTQYPSMLCISLLIHSILRYSGYYIGEAVPSAESYKGDLWLWLVSSKPMSQLPPSQARTLPCTFPRAKHMPSTIPCTFPALVARVSSYHLSGVIEACESGDPLHVV